MVPGLPASICRTAGRSFRTRHNSWDTLYGPLYRSSPNCYRGMSRRAGLWYNDNLTQNIVQPDLDGSEHHGFSGHSPRSLC